MQRFIGVARGLMTVLMLVVSAACGETTPPPPQTPPSAPPVAVAKGNCANPIPNQLTPEPLKVKGYFVDACGQPIPGSRVTVRNAFARPSDAPFRVVPNGDGAYAQDLPLVTAYQAWGEVTTRYDNTDYCLWVQPADGSSSFTPKDGAIQNFVWRTGGERPDSKPGDRRYYGGSLWLEPSQASSQSSIPDDSILYLELKPTMPLINGSQGKVIDLHIPWSKRYQTAETPELNGVALGKYQVYAAIQLPNDPTLYKVYLRLDNGSDSPFTDSVTAKFAGDRQGGAVTCGASPSLFLGLSFTAGN